MTTGGYPDRSWVDDRVAVGPSPLGGLGTFARAPIAAGEVVFRWGGVVFTPEEIRAGKTKPGTAAAVAEGVYLASPGDGESDPSDFTNHSSDPNLWLADAVTLVARRAIAAGEELTGGYAMREVDEGYVAGRACQCRSPLCRGRLTGRDWRLPELHARYRGHFSPFLNRRIAALAEGYVVRRGPLGGIGGEGGAGSPPGGGARPPHGAGALPEPDRGGATGGEAIAEPPHSARHPVGGWCRHARTREVDRPRSPSARTCSGEPRPAPSTGPPPPGRRPATAGRGRHSAPCRLGTTGNPTRPRAPLLSCPPLPFTR